jgi:hypothetical protein
MDSFRFPPPDIVGKPYARRRTLLVVHHQRPSLKIIRPHTKALNLLLR